MLEREAKLVVPDGFVVPFLGGDDAPVAEPGEVRRLQATYYDTRTCAWPGGARACAAATTAGR